MQLFMLFIVIDKRNLFLFFISPWKHVGSHLIIIRTHKLALLLLNMTCPALANSVNLDQLASSEANWSGSALFVIKYVNF